MHKYCIVCKEGLFISFWKSWKKCQRSYICLVGLKQCKSSPVTSYKIKDLNCFDHSFFRQSEKETLKKHLSPKFMSINTSLSSSTGCPCHRMLCQIHLTKARTFHIFSIITCLTLGSLLQKIHKCIFTHEAIHGKVLWDVLF